MRTERVSTVDEPMRVMPQNTARQQQKNVSEAAEFYDTRTATDRFSTAVEQTVCSVDTAACCSISDIRDDGTATGALLDWLLNVGVIAEPNDVVRAGRVTSITRCGSSGRR